MGNLRTDDVVRVLSLAKDVNQKGAEKIGKAKIASDLFENTLQLLLFGVADTRTKSAMIAFSKDRTAIVAMDAKSRMFKYSKNFKELFDTIIDRCSDDLMVGEEYEEAFCEKVGIKTHKDERKSIETPDDSIGDGGDDLL